MASYKTSGRTDNQVLLQQVTIIESMECLNECLYSLYPDVFAASPLSLSGHCMRGRER